MANRRIVPSWESWLAGAAVWLVILGLIYFTEVPA
jgi:hypothetical protein